MANFGIEVSETNLAGTNLQDKTFSSRALSLKDVIEGTGQLTTDGSGNGTYTIYHYLPYPPVHLFWWTPGNVNAVKHPGFAPWIDEERGNTWGFMDNVFFSVIANSTTLTVTISSAVPNTLYKWKYFIFVEKSK